MRLSDEMNFPHPVLANWRDDYSSGSLDVEIIYREDKDTGRLDVVVKSVLSCSEIEQLINDGKAAFGCFVVCKSTGYRRLIEVGLSEGRHTFEQGELLDTVVFRPLVWVRTEIGKWQPAGVHEEYSGDQRLRCGDIVAMAEESSVEVRRADLPALETIFQLKVAEAIEEGDFVIDLDQEKITILAARETYDLVETLRACGDAASAVVMNSLYVPVVMKVLSQVSSPDGEGNFAEFSGRRWVAPFQRRCNKQDIRHDESEILSNALRLMENPFHSLDKLTGGL